MSLPGLTCQPNRHTVAHGSFSGTNTSGRAQIGKGLASSSTRAHLYEKNFTRWFDGFRTTPVNSQRPSTPDERDEPLTIEDGSENATRRQLVQVLLRDVLRKSGIPPQWIDCQMLLLSSRTRGRGMYVRLVVKHWDKRLMNYAFAFQQTLLADIEHFEPRASEWLHGISWQLEVAGTCPYTECPTRLSGRSPNPRKPLKSQPVRRFQPPRLRPACP